MYSKWINFNCVWFVILDILVWGENQHFFQQTAGPWQGSQGTARPLVILQGWGLAGAMEENFSPWISVEWLIPALGPHAEAGDSHCHQICAGGGQDSSGEWLGLRDHPQEEPEEHFGSVFSAPAPFLGGTAPVTRLEPSGPSLLLRARGAHAGLSGGPHSAVCWTKSIWCSPGRS